MKHILTYIFLLVLPVLSFSQVSESFGGRFIVTSKANPLPASDKFAVTGIFKHPRANYTADSIQLGDIFVDCNCNAFTVDSIYSVTGNIIELRVNPQDTTVNLIPSCTGGIIRINSPPNGTYTFPANIPPEIMDCFLNYNFQALSGLDTAYLANDTLYLVTPSDTLQIYIPTPYLNTLPDVDTANISNGDFLMWDSIAGNWIPQEIPPDYLNNLPDVDTANIDIDDILQWDGSNWIMTSPVELIGDGGGAYGSGLAGRTAYWLDDSTLVHTAITYSSTILDASALTGAIKLPAGTDAQDPVWAAGMLRYNTTANGLQGYDGTAERYLPWASYPTTASGSILYSDGSKLIPSTVLTNRSNEIGIGQWSSFDRGNYSAQIVGSFYIGHYSSPSMTFSGLGQVLNSSFITNINATAPYAAALYARNTNVNSGTMSANFDAADSGQGVWSEIRLSSISQPAYTASFQNHGSSTMLMLRGTTKDSPAHCCGTNSFNKVWRLVETQGYRLGSGYILNAQSPIMHRIDLGEASSASDVDSYIRFYVRKDSVLSEFMRITGGDGSGIGTSVGGVGILTSAPTANLDINGNTRIRTMPDSIATYITMADASGYIYRATPGDVVAAGSGSTNSIYNLLPNQNVTIDPNTYDLQIGTAALNNSGEFEFYALTMDAEVQDAFIYAGSRDSSTVATGEGFFFNAMIGAVGAEDGIIGVNYEYFGTVWNAAVFGDSMLFAPYPGSELNMTINGLPDDPVNPYKVMVQDTVTDRVYLTSIDSLLGPEKWGAISTSTDGSGDIVVAHGMGVTPTVVDIQFTGTSGSATPYVYVVLTDGTDATNFTIRVFDMTGAAVTSTAVTATWHCKT